jgi:hypothetical protein
MATTPFIALPVLISCGQKVEALLLSGVDTALVGPPGCGVTSLARRVIDNLKDQKQVVEWADLDCAKPLDALKNRIAVLGKRTRQSASRVLVMDNCSTLPAADVKQIVGVLREAKKARKITVLWVGNVDCALVQGVADFTPHEQPESHICYPQLTEGDLLQIYQAIASHRGCVWGEAFLYFALDWCANDLASIQALARQFYGDWKDRVYDETVAEYLIAWLAKEIRVERMRICAKTLTASPSERSLLVRLVTGGKLEQHGTELHHERDSAVRGLYLRGFLAPNLLPKHYRFRNLLARYVAEESLGHKPDVLALFRLGANGRIGDMLQDIEASLREMVRAAFRLMQPPEVKSLLESRKLPDKLCDASFRESLTDWASKVSSAAPGTDLKAELGKFILEEQKVFGQRNHLWASVCRLYRITLGIGDQANEPTPEKVPEYLLFSELAEVVLMLENKLFLAKARNPKRLFATHPRDRWKTHLERIRRLRNEAAHLRNISFQDIEDLLESLKEMRRDQLDFGTTI